MFPHRAANTLLILTGHKGAVSCVDISSEGHKLCSASWDKTVSSSTVLSVELEVDYTA